MPTVSIIVPCYNEEATIHLLLEALYAQNYPCAHMEVIIADGLSTDRTRDEIRAFQQTHPDLSIRVVDNIKQSIPSGLNRAIEASSGEFIVRLDAHSMPYADYVERSVAALQAGWGENVGGIWEIRPGGKGWLSRAIAVAASHPLGAGDAQYRRGGRPHAVDTVPFGAFRRTLLDRIGPFNEDLLSNEDYEFNFRVRQSGGRVWLDPTIRSIYFARPTISALLRQYWRYGYWKARMLRLYPRSLRWRQILPPLFVSGLLLMSLASLFNSIARWILVIGLGVYVLILVIAGAQSAVKKKDAFLLCGIPVAITTMHMGWGSAFLWSLLSSDG